MAAAATKRLLADLKYMGVGAVGGGALSFFFDVCQVKGRSMLPHLSEEEGDYVLVSKYKFPTRGLERGGVYTFWSPDDPEKTIIKRVLGKEGDRFSYYKRGFRDLVTVPTGHVWVEGDNKPLSEDSRFYGPIPAGLARGAARCVVWPPSRWRLLERLPDAASPAAVPAPPPFQDRSEDKAPWGGGFVEEEEGGGLGEQPRGGGDGSGGGADAPAWQRSVDDGASPALGFAASSSHASPLPPAQGGESKQDEEEPVVVPAAVAVAVAGREEEGKVPPPLREEAPSLPGAGVQLRVATQDAVAPASALPPSHADEAADVAFSNQMQTEANNREE